MKTIEISVLINNTLFQGDIRNFEVVEASGWDDGRPQGHGATQADAIADFIESWLLKFDEEIQTVIV